jgi:hypothetical protein
MTRRVNPTTLREEVEMTTLKSTVKHARYVMGSLSAVMFAQAVGAKF